MTFRTTGDSFVLLTIYRPGSLKTTSAFFDELMAVLGVLALQRFPVIIGGDHNVHLHDISDIFTVRLTDLLASFGIDTARVWTYSSAGYPSMLSLLMTLMNEICPFVAQFHVEFHVLVREISISISRTDSCHCRTTRHRVGSQCYHMPTTRLSGRNRFPRAGFLRPG